MRKKKKKKNGYIYLYLCSVHNPGINDWLKAAHQIILAIL
jgi:hypothetical protein